jgi:flavin reductase (DIM6/NTAB) family NADH-FMN oxidoreductase RutF
MFESISRQKFRRYFQPSRVLIAVIPKKGSDQVNLITLCFHMYCSYKPAMMAFSVWHGSYTHSLIEDVDECVLAVPGEKLAHTALLCGITSGKDFDKIGESKLTLKKSKFVRVPSIQECIANVEMRIVNKVRTGDHITVFGEVLSFSVNKNNKERCLISVGPDFSGYTVLAKQGIHRIGVVEQ